MQTCAAGVVARSPISYVRDAKLYGSLFEPNYNVTSTSNMVSGVDAGFFVDQDEPRRAVEWLQGKGL